MSPEERKQNNELAIQKRRELEAAKSQQPDQSLLQTIEHIPNPRHMTIRELIVKDGSIRIHCAICDHSWLVNIHEQNWVFEEELKCRRCMAQAGAQISDERPLTPIFIEGTIGAPESEEEDFERY